MSVTFFASTFFYGEVIDSRISKAANILSADSAEIPNLVKIAIPSSGFPFAFATVSWRRPSSISSRMAEARW